MRTGKQQRYSRVVLSAIAGELAWKRADMWNGLATYVDWADDKKGRAICRAFADKWSVGPGHTLEGILEALLAEARVLTEHANVLRAAAGQKANKRRAISRRPARATRRRVPQLVQIAA
jgi:hypothetical protein